MIKKSKKQASRCPFSVPKMIDLVNVHKDALSKQELNSKSLEKDSICEKTQNLKPISVISSIGFDFFNVENEKETKEKLINFSCPFLNRKGFSNILDLKKIS